MSLCLTVAGYSTPFWDEAHVTYGNGTYTGDDPVEKLMHDFHYMSASDMIYKELAEPVRYCKETKGGQEQMCDAMRKLLNEEMVDYEIQMIQMLMNDFGCTFQKAFEKANVDPDIAPAVKKAFGMNP